MTSLALSMTTIACRATRRALTGAEETRVVAVLIALGLAGATGTILHAFIVALHW